MPSEFLKQLIQLLAQHGGTFTCPLSELQQLGLELSLQNISSDNAAIITLRLGARIYYVPAKEATAPCPTPPIPETSTVHPPTGQSKPSAISPEQEITAVNNLNNRLSRPSPTPSPDAEESTLQSMTISHQPRAKSDLDLYLLEQNAVVKRTANAKQQATELRNATREYPWETRKPQ